MIYIEQLRDYLEDNRNMFKQDDKIGRPIDPEDALTLIDVTENFLKQIEDEHDQVKNSLKHILTVIEKSKKDS